MRLRTIVAIASLTVSCARFVTPASTVTDSHDGGPRSDVPSDGGRDDSVIDATRDAARDDDDAVGTDTGPFDAGLSPSGDLSPHQPCIALPDGTVRCWGVNTTARVGLDPDAASVDEPHEVASITTARRVISSRTFSAAVLADGTVACWGAGRPCLAETRETLVAPVAIAGLANVEDIAIDSSEGCALLRSGRVMCWGDNRAGVVDPDRISDAFLPPRDIGLADVLQVSVANGVACAVRRDGALFCWGFSVSGQFAGAIQTEQYSRVVRIAAVDGVLAVEVGDAGTCVIQGDRTVRCWGACDPQFVQCCASGAIDGIADARAVRLDASGGCALLGDGTVRCWGPSDSARASDGGLPVPMTVPGLQHIEQIGAANGTRYARDADGAFFAWGSNWSGSLGSGERDDSPLPLRIEW